MACLILTGISGRLFISRTACPGRRKGTDMLHACIKKRFGSGNGTAAIDVQAAGGVTVLFGASGAGKTSILRAIAGIITPDAGRISLGENIYFDSEAGINVPMQERKVGYVFQNHVLFPHLIDRHGSSYRCWGSQDDGTPPATT
jgi:molybdate transport system ATP-binding protein